MSRRPGRGAAGGGRRCCSVTGVLAALSTVLAAASIYSVASSNLLFLRRDGLHDVLRGGAGGDRTIHQPHDTSVQRQPPRPAADSAPRELRPRKSEPPLVLPDASSDWGTIAPMQPRPGAQQPTGTANSGGAPASLSVAVPTAAAREVPLLVIGIPTVGRAGDAAYLIRTLCYIEAQARPGAGMAGLAAVATETPPAQVRERLSAAGASGTKAAVLAAGSRAPHHPLEVRVIVMDNGHGR